MAEMRKKCNTKTYSWKRVITFTTTKQNKAKSDLLVLKFRRDDDDL